MRTNPRWARVSVPGALDMGAELQRIPEGWSYLSYFWEGRWASPTDTPQGPRARVACMSSGLTARNGLVTSSRSGRPGRSGLLARQPRQAQGKCAARGHARSRGPERSHPARAGVREHP